MFVLQKSGIFNITEKKENIAGLNLMHDCTTAPIGLLFFF